MHEKIWDLNPKFPINMKCLWYIAPIVWSHAWSVLNSNVWNASIQREAELYIYSRSMDTHGELREMLCQIEEMSAVLQVTETINQTRGNAEYTIAIQTAAASFTDFYVC